jgi:hypothetical protein
MAKRQGRPAPLAGHPLCETALLVARRAGLKPPQRLARAYGKLDVHSRAELGRVMFERDRPAETLP